MTLVCICKIYSKLLYCFGLYFIYFIAIVCNAQEKTSDKTTYQNLPVIYNIDNECRPQTTADCSSKAWHYLPATRLLTPMVAKTQVDLEDCFKLCLDTPKCGAITRQGTTSDCSIFNIDSTDHDNYFDTYVSYFLICCEVNSHRRNAYSFYNNLPLVFPTNLQQVCKPMQSNETTTSCPSKVFIHWERKGIVPYKFYKNKNQFECMNECLTDVKCQMFNHYVNHNFQTNCKLGIKSTNNSYWTWDRYGHVYQLSCCQLNNEKIWTPTNHNLMMLYHPAKFCKTVSTKNEKNCKVRIWHVEEEVRMKGHFKVSSLDYLENCLKECLETQMCFSVSIDWTYVRCLLFARNGYTNKYYEQVTWTSYTLKCCDSFNSESFINSDKKSDMSGNNSSGKLQSDASILKNLPTIVYNLLYLLWTVNLLM